MDSKYTCALCPKSFCHQSNLSRHQRKCHSIEPKKARQSNFTCTLCPFACPFLAELRRHLQTSHNVVIVQSQHKFKSKGAFHSWKQEVERSTSSSFVQKRGCRKLPSGSLLIHYECHRSGKFISRSTGQRHLKSQGTCKAGVRCTAEIVCIILPSSDVIVEFYETHTGHSNDIGHIHLNIEERTLIAGKLQEGLSFDAILDDIRNNTKSNENERLSLLTRKDIHNISSSFGLNAKEQLHPEESLSESEERNDCLDSSLVEQKLNDVLGLVQKYQPESTVVEGLIKHLDDMATYIQSQCESQNTINKPTDAEKENLAESTLNNEEMINIHRDFDHLY